MRLLPPGLALPPPLLSLLLPPPSLLPPLLLLLLPLLLWCTPADYCNLVTCHALRHVLGMDGGGGGRRYCAIRKIGHGIDGMVCVNYFAFISCILALIGSAFQGFPLPLHDEVRSWVCGWREGGTA